MQRSHKDPVCGMDVLESSEFQSEHSHEKYYFCSEHCKTMITDMIPSWLPQNISMQTIYWMEFLLATPVVLWGGWPFFVRGWQSLRTWNLNMFTLIALGVSVAWTYSVIALLFPALFPPQMIKTDGTVHVYFESAAVIVALVLMGQVLELRARFNTNEAIKMLLSLTPNTATLLHSYTLTVLRSRYQQKK